MRYIKNLIANAKANLARQSPGRVVVNS